MRPQLSITYDEKFSGVGDTKALELEPLLSQYLPSTAFASSTESLTAAQLADWKPPGELLKTYQKDGKQYEIWCASLSDPRAREILRNMQILVPFFIEGGTCQDLDDEDWTMERWKLFLTLVSHGILIDATLTLALQLPGPPRYRFFAHPLYFNRIQHNISLMGLSFTSNPGSLSREGPTRRTIANASTHPG